MEELTKQEERTLREFMLRSISHKDIFPLQIAYANAKEVWEHLSADKERVEVLFGFIITKWISVFAEEGKYPSLETAKSMSPGDLYPMAQKYASEILPKLRELRDGKMQENGQLQKVFYTKAGMAAEILKILNSTDEKTAAFALMMLLYNFPLDGFNIFGAEPLLIPFVSIRERPPTDIFDDEMLEMVKKDSDMQNALAAMRGCFHTIFEDYSNMGYAMEARSNYLALRASIDPPETLKKKEKFLNYYFLYFFQEATKTGYKGLLDMVHNIRENVNTTVMSVAQEKVPQVIGDINKGQKDLLEQLMKMDDEAVQKLSENPHFANLVFKANYFLQKGVLADMAAMGDRKAKKQLETMEKIEEKRKKGEQMEEKTEEAPKGVL